MRQSGNPKGRPPEIINLRTSFMELLQEQDPSAGNGGRVMSKQEALMRTLFDQAARGSSRSTPSWTSGNGSVDGQSDRPTFADI